MSSLSDGPDPTMPDFLGVNTPLYLLLFGILALVVLTRRVRVLGTIVSFGVMALGIAILVPVLAQRAEFDPALDRVVKALRLDDNGQKVVGREMRVAMAPDGHFWVRVKIGNAEQRMLIDSGATVTALSAKTAQAAGLEPENSLVPVVLQTANGAIPATTATAPELRIGNIVARDVPVVVSPAFGDMNVIGMNFLSRLKSWRVEGRTLILEPHHPQEVT